MTQRVELLLGCGRSRKKKMFLADRPEWNGLLTVDSNPLVKPDVICDLDNYICILEDNTVDEIHMYEVLEHTGFQGDYQYFFEQFSDIYRVLKPDGVLFATVPLPTSVWAWGDPSHTRIFPKEWLIFLNQLSYENVHTSPMSDFRYLYKADFDVIHCNEVEESLQFGLRAVKPSRCTIT